MSNGDGAWPRALRRALYDFLPENDAPPRDGIVGPTEEVPAWIGRVAALPGSVEVVRRAREDAEGRAKTAEDKAARLVQTVLALLAITLALGSYQLEFALTHSRYWSFGLIPVAYAIYSLALSAFEALQVDRVGIYSMPDGSELDGADAAQVPALLLRAEENGRRLADWTANHKHTDLMQARAWMTRGLAALLIASLIAGISRAIPQPSSSQHQPKAPITAKSPSRHAQPHSSSKKR
jgi:hypothetical protein